VTNSDSYTRETGNTIRRHASLYWRAKEGWGMNATHPSIAMTSRRCPVIPGPASWATKS